MTNEHIIKRIDSSSQECDDIRSFLERIDPGVKCDKCGGLPYDLVFSSGDMKYKFCLYKIEKGDQILAETNYERLYEYTKRNGVMMSLRRERHVKRET